MSKEDEFVEEFTYRLHGTWHHPKIQQVPKIIDDVRRLNPSARAINRLIERLPHGLTGDSGETLREIRDQLLRVRQEILQEGQAQGGSQLNSFSVRPIAKDIWQAIEKEFGISKIAFGMRISFVTDPFVRRIIFRDVEDSYILASSGFSKPAVILAGGVIEELLRRYLRHKKITPVLRNFDGYIKTCEKEGLLKSGISRLSDSVRHFRNLVHLSKEKTRKHMASKATAKGAVSSIFTVANDL